VKNTRMSQMKICCKIDHVPSNLSPAILVAH
jgi:hypothetical protein